MYSRQIDKGQNFQTITIFIISAFIDKDKIEDYETHREKFVVKGRGLGFKIAVKQMDEFKSNPTV